MRRPALLLVLPVLLAAVAAFAAPPAARAAVPCRDRIYNDWYKDGLISSAYPVGCYRDALRHVPADARIYSNLTDDIRAALLAAIRREHGQKVPVEIGKGFKKHGARGAQVALLKPSRKPPSGPSTGGSTVASASTSGSSGTPLPILVLGGVAIALAAAGAIGAGVRYTRNRRGA